MLTALTGAWLRPDRVLAATRPAAPYDPRTASVRQTVSPGRTLSLYLALPGRGHGRRSAVLVVHDASGLDDLARDLTRRMGRLGYVGCAPDLLSRLSGTPSDPAAARIMVATLDPIEALNDAIATAQWLGRNPPGEQVLTGQVAAVGLGWGAALVRRLAARPESALAAAVLIEAPIATVTAGGATPVLSLDRYDPASDRMASFLAEHLR